MAKKKIIAPNIIRGGAAIPLGDNIYLLKGKKHSQGGIDIGKDLEAEGDEVVKMNSKSIKVVTAQKIMGGKSPAELVVNASPTGEQEKVFNDVFKYQEKFKDRNNLNDDGTKKAKFGKKKSLIGTEQKNKEFIYYDDTYIEPAIVKAFDSEKDYNRYYGEQFGKQVAEGMNNAAPYVLEATMLPFTISGAVETPMSLYQGIKGAKILLTKGKKAFGKKVLGMIDDMNGYVKEGSHFRIVDKPAIDDAIESGLIRSKTGLYHGTPEYLRNNFSKYLNDIPNWEKMDANKLKELLESKGAFNEMSDVERKIAKFKIGNSTNHGGTVGYFKDTPYPNYNISNSNYVIETPESIGSFVAGHGGEEFVDIPLEYAGATLLKTNGSVKGAFIPSKGSSYWQYNPFFEMWKNKKFTLGGMKQFKDRKKATDGGAWASLIGEYGAPAVVSTAQLINAGLMFPVNLGSVIGANVYTKKQLDKTKEATLDYNTETHDAQTKYNKDKYNKLNELLDKYYKEDLADLEKHKIVRKDAVYSPVKLKTRININPQLQQIQRERDRNIRSIVENTASSKDALNRIRLENLEARDKNVAIQGQKENIETQLINQDLLQRKATMEKQVEANLRLDELRARDLMTYYNNLANLKKGYNQNKLQSTLKNLEDVFNTENIKRTSDFNAESSYRQGRMENRMNLIQGISDSFGQFFNEVNNSAMTAAKLQQMQDAYGKNKVNPQTSFSPVGMQNPNSQYFGNSGQNSVMTKEQFDTLYNQILSRGYNLELGRMGGKFKVKRRNK